MSSAVTILAAHQPALSHTGQPPGRPALRAQCLTTPLLRLLVEQRRVVRLGNDVLMSATAYADALARVTQYLDEHAEATVAQLRDHLGVTRRLVAEFTRRPRFHAR